MHDDTLAVLLNDRVLFVTGRPQGCQAMEDVVILFGTCRVQLVCVRAAKPCMPH